MQPRTKFISILFVTVICLSVSHSCRSTGGSDLRDVDGSPGKVRISLVGLNDLHGGGLSANTQFSVGQPGDRRPVKIGGPAAMKAYLNIVEQGNPDGTLILDAGDAIQGSLVSNKSNGQAVIALYKYLSVDAAAIGNHEFDWGGILAPTDAEQGTFDSPFLRAAEKAEFPYLAHNLTFRGKPLAEHGTLTDAAGKKYQLRFPDGLPKLASYRIFHRNGVRVAVIGGITETAMASSSPANYRDVTIKPIGESLAALARDLRQKQGAQIVVLLAHAGFVCGFSAFDFNEDWKNTADQCPEVAAGTDEIRKIFAQLRADGAEPKQLIDAVVAGHVHAPQAHYYEGVPVIQNQDKGLSFGRIDLTYDTVNRKVAATRIFPPTFFCHTHFSDYPGCNPRGPDLNQPFPAALGAEKAPEYDGAVVNVSANERSAQRAMAPFKDLFELKDKTITSLKSGLINDRFSESPMARCYADAIRLAAGADLVIAISGSIRESLPKGDVTAGHIFEVAPFDGKSVVVAMTGQELDQYIKTKNKDFNQKSMPIISDGWKIKVSCAGAGEAVTPLAIWQEQGAGNWIHPNPAQNYKVLVSGYLFENPFFDDIRKAGRFTLLDNDRELLTAGFSRTDRPKSCEADVPPAKKCDDSHADSRWCGLSKACP